MSQLILKHPDFQPENVKFDTVEVHAGEPRDTYGSLIPPIYQTSTFYFASTDDAVKACGDYAESFAYSRITNPSLDYMEQKLAALEHGKGAVSYASGMGAVAGALFAALKCGDHVIFTKAKYSGTEDITSDWLPRFGIEHDSFQADHLEELEPLIKPNTKVIYVETPANPTMVLVDLAEVAKIAHRHGAKVFVDNTFATPYNTNPLDLGVDVVIHSLTKYIGGHGDLLGGAVISNDTEFLRQCRLGTLMHFGAVMAPFTAFLVCRGMKTLGVRMRQHNENALKIARWLEADPRIETVRYPFLESNPQYDIAKKQMRGGGGMISFDVKGGLEAGKKFINSLKLCTLAVSLGDTETLVEQAAAMTHTMIPKEVREAAGITDGMIRMSVGLEDPDDIIADLDQALSR
jgi:methionine-gamma-lyase